MGGGGGGWGSVASRAKRVFQVDTGADEEASESLQEVLQLPDDLRVHALHEDGEALVAHQSLLGLELLVDELLQGDAVHRVLQGQLRRDKHRRYKSPSRSKEPASLALEKGGMEGGGGYISSRFFSRFRFFF